MPSPALFKSRVGKRIVLLFVVCTLLPLWVLAVLSLSEVRGLLIDQGKKRIAATTKGYALTVYERLLATRDVARLFVTNAGGTTTLPPYFAEQYSFLGLADGSGRLDTIKGNSTPIVQALVEDYRRMSSPPGSLLRVADSERLFLLLDIAGPGGRGVLIGELNPAFVWGDEDDFKAGSTICVVDSTDMKYLHCPRARAMGLPRLLANAGVGAEPADLVWTEAGVTYRGRVWAQFMKRDFGANDWYFTVSVPEADLLSSIDSFRRNFMLVVALALLLIAWISIGQIRAILVPLGRLAAGTRRIGQDKFGTQVKVETDDEFGELGDAFNSMSIRLGRQFQIARVYAELDRMILVREDLDAIVEAALRQLRLLLPVLEPHAVLLDRADPKRARRLSLRGEPSDADNTLRVEVTPVSAAVQPDLAGVALSPHAPGDSNQDWERGIEHSTTAVQWVQPLAWGRNSCGWLWLVAPAGTTISDDDCRLVGDLAGRIALAIASAWRDDEFYQQSHYDPLTGLPNRLLFADRLQREVARGKRDSAITAILFIDLDQFKSVNDSQGHTAGDQLLCEAARRISATVREVDTVSRHGGDEFTVLLADIHEQRDALRAGDAIVDALSAPFRIGGQDCFLSASVGIAIYPINGETAEELLKNADTAMYRAKAAGRGQCLFFEDRMNAETMARVVLDRELRLALERGEFELYFHPQIFLATDRVVAAEALLRWHHPQRGLLAPGAFIEVAEDSGLISAIGKWVIERACNQIAAWRGAGLDIDRIAINVSARQLRDADFVDHILTHVVTAGLAASVEIEITETAMMERVDLVKDKLDAIAAAGCKIALDDFGTGFSSLGYLKRLPVHVVKIDRSFIEDIDKSAESLAFVESIIAMAHAMGKIVVAEGVELDEQVRLLRERDCDILQGYFFSKPLPAADFHAFVKAFRG